MKKTILTPNTIRDRKHGPYLRVPMTPIPPTEQNLRSLAATWNEGRDPEAVLAIAERRARRVLESEGVTIRASEPKRLPAGSSLVGVPGGSIVRKTHERKGDRWQQVVPALSERAEVAVAVLWAAFKAREAMKSGDTASAIVESVIVGTLSERMLVLPYEAEIARLASNRSKGGKARAATFVKRNADLAGRVEKYVSDGTPISKAAAKVAAELEREGKRIDPKTAENAYRKASPIRPR